MAVCRSAPTACKRLPHRKILRTLPTWWRGRWRQLKKITRDNDGFAPQLTVQNVGWNNEQYKVQGWLLGPLKTDAGKRYPMIVNVHGGPARQLHPVTWAAGTLIHELTQKGYFVFLPNPRGSFGQGQAFTRANMARLWRRRLARHPGRHRCRANKWRPSTASAWA